MSADWNTILAALEKASREEVGAYSIIMDRVNDDASAVRYGALVPRITFLTGYSASVVRYHLRKMRKSGAVLEDPPSHLYGMSRWWPVGLWEKLQQERAAQEGGAA